MSCTLMTAGANSAPLWIPIATSIVGLLVMIIVAFFIECAKM